MEETERFSDRFFLRVSPQLFNATAEYAKANGVTISSLIRTAVAKEIGFLGRISEPDREHKRKNEPKPVCEQIKLGGRKIRRA